MIPRFRAWLKKDKEMIDVEEINFNNGELDFIGDAITWMCKNKDCVLMQSTGLKDKNDKEIFEGDVVKCYMVTKERDHEYIGVVRFEDFSFVIVDEKDTYDPLWNYKSGFVDQETEIEIIGNIYENSGKV